MAILRKINSKAKTDTNTGYGTNAADYGGRFINKSGQPNIEKRGISYFERISWYHTMLTIPRWKFMLLIFLFFIGVNLVFAIIYYAIGVDHLNGMITTTPLEKFGEAFFFSAQTFTTVGYGRVNPTGFTASAVSSLQALLGLLSFAVVTGLLYGRFSRPKAYLKFSDNALIAPFKDGVALMLRLAPYKNTSLTDAEAKLTLGMMVEENGKASNKFFPLELELEKINALTLSWTLVHPITENSPFYKFTAEDFANTSGEIIVFVKAFDDMFSNTVVARSSYTFKEVVVGAKFIPMYQRSADGASTILHLDKLNSHNDVDVAALLNITTLAASS
jgi:Inward rectifier potassium channel C-terminal domain/Inward rectifier potassium channel transmembrane domain